MAAFSGKKRTSVSPEDRELFIAAVSDAKPLPASARDRVLVPVGPPGQRPAVRSDAALPAEVALTVDSSGERFAARAPGVSLEQVAQLRAGKVHVEETIDLHRLSREDGVGRLRELLLRGRRIGRRCVLVVHGRGVHGSGQSPMRDAVRTELLGPLSGIVHAIAADTSDGATYVVLRGEK